MPFQSSRLFLIPSIVAFSYAVASLCTLRFDPYVTFLIFCVSYVIIASVKEHQEDIYRSSTVAPTTAPTTIYGSNGGNSNQRNFLLSSGTHNGNNINNINSNSSNNTHVGLLYYSYNYTVRDFCVWLMLLVVMNFHWLLWHHSERINVQWWGIYTSLILLVTWTIVRPVVPMGYVALFVSSLFSLSSVSSSLITSVGQCFLVRSRTNVEMLSPIDTVSCQKRKWRS